MARLATIRPDGSPHLVPVTYATVDEAIVTMVDHKPKSTTRLQRLINIETEPRVAILVDEWSEDWSRLAWARFDGVAEIHSGGTTWSRSRQALATRYSQYRDAPPDGPAIVVAIESVSYWASTG